jgi:hypothetical protein
MKLATLGATPRFSVAHLSVTGNVAALDEELKATN